MTTIKIGVRDFRLQIGERLDDVLRGAIYTITRQGRPTAVVLSVTEYKRLREKAGESGE